MAWASAHPEEDHGRVFLALRGARHAKIIRKSEAQNGKAAHAQEIPSCYTIAIGMFSQIKVKHDIPSRVTLPVQTVGFGRFIRIIVPMSDFFAVACTSILLANLRCS